MRRKEEVVWDALLAQAVPDTKRGVIVGVSLWGRQGNFVEGATRALTAPNRRRDVSSERLPVQAGQGP